ncbi:hypothetical protein [Pontixanthobacter sp.]|uniref:hypothetical protein n=1 Tax=Pontixanthobacter sp. TaxID=2792078 RepID=UPI003C7B36F2
MARSKVTSIDNTVPNLEANQEIDPDIYNGIAKCAQLLAVQLIESSFNITPSFFEEIEEANFNIDVTDVNDSFDEKSRIASCMFQFENYRKRGRKKVFSLKDKFVIFYRIPAECDEFHAIAFARRTGLMAAYPYFRAHVAQTASMANAEVPILPTVASMPIKKQRRNNVKGEA